MNFQYQENQNLFDTLVQHKLTFSFKPHAIFKDLQILTLHTKNTHWDIWIDDEYKDLNLENPLICLFLGLHHLESYVDSNDFLEWCNEFNLPPSSPTLLDYYKSLEKTSNELKAIFGTIDPQVTSFDYQLRSGPVQELTAFRANK